MEESPYYVTFDANISGIPKKSLKTLRDTIANSITQSIAVVEAPTGADRCGYLILIKDSKKAIWTGDSFRKSGGDEGESAYKSAEALLSLYGIEPVRWEIVSLDEVYFFPERKAREILIGLVQEIIKQIPDSQFCRPIEMEPQYIGIK